MYLPPGRALKTLCLPVPYDDGVGGVLTELRADFSLFQNPHIISGVHPASCSVGMGVLSQGVKRSELEWLVQCHG